MASYTPNLNLYKKDPIADGNDFFNIKTMMNDNWDKIDEAVQKFFNTCMQNGMNVRYLEFLESANWVVPNGIIGDQVLVI